MFLYYDLIVDNNEKLSLQSSITIFLFFKNTYAFRCGNGKLMIIVRRSYDSLMKLRELFDGGSLRFLTYVLRLSCDS